MATASEAWFKIIHTENVHTENEWDLVTLEGIKYAKKEKDDDDNEAKELDETEELASALKEYGTWLLVYVPSVRYVSTQPLSYPSDSDEGPDSMVIISPDRMKFIEQYMTDHRFVLIRSPPYSGKSTLGQWIRDSLILQGHRAYYISLAGIQGEDALFNKEPVQRFWQTRIGYTWDEIFAREILASEDSMSLSIIIDEAQVIYGNAAPFLGGSLKEFMSDTKKNASLRIILLASYDPLMIQQITPISFLYTLGLDALRLRRDEFNQLLERFVENRNPFKMRFLA
ncbi:hypothetical protein BGX38DRAFT_1268176 [Terfezia claveryi]|nr:hypothetical protein BGX38DRAFT_1268176 [Terfezia claveryi]